MTTLYAERLVEEGRSVSIQSVCRPRHENVDDIRVGSVGEVLVEVRSIREKFFVQYYWMYSRSIARDSN